MDCGLCVAFYDLLEAEDPIVYPAEGCCHATVKFRLILFRPFNGEIIEGKVLSSSPGGLKVSLGFYDDIVIPSHLLPSPSEYEVTQSTWLWKFNQLENNNGEYPMELGSSV
jgi:DNA-directed RNA polymerase III subunit RPC8